MAAIAGAGLLSRSRIAAGCRGRRARRGLTLEDARAGEGRGEAAWRDAARVALGVLPFVGLPLATFAGFAGVASLCARRARFQALRAEADCLRARFASRLASFRRLRARFNSSFAMRTRCFATSACSRALSKGSAGRSAGSLSLFFILLPAKREGRPVSHNRYGVSTLDSYPQNLCITMWTERARPAKRRTAARACVAVSEFSPALSCSARCSASQSRDCVRPACCDRAPRRRSSGCARRARAPRPARNRVHTIRSWP